MTAVPRLSPAVVMSAASRALGRGIQDAAHVPLGWGNENWRVTTTAGERFVVKCGPAESAAKWSATVSAYNLARHAGVPAPEHVWFEASCPEFGGAVMRILSWVDGVRPESVVVDADSVRRFFGELGAALRGLHLVALPAFSSRLDGSAPAFRAWEDYVAYRLPQMEERVCAAAAFTPTAFESLAAEIRGLARDVSSVVTPSLCHRDLYLSNLLATADGGLAALIDFDLAEAWDRAVDLVKLRWLVFPAYPGAEAAFESAYFETERPPAWDGRVRLVELLELANHVANACAVGDAGYEKLGRDRLHTILT